MWPGPPGRCPQETPGAVSETPGAGAVSETPGGRLGGRGSRVGRLTSLVVWSSLFIEGFRLESVLSKTAVSGRA